MSLSSVHKKLRALTGCQAGAVAIEMALIAPILVFVFMGGFDFGMAFCETHRYAGAARAGAQFALVYGQGTLELELEEEETLEDLIAAAALSDYLPCIGAEEVDVTVTCWCPDPDDGAECDCGPGGPMYVEVRVEGTRDLFFNYPGVPNPLELSETALIRLR